MWDDEVLEQQDFGVAEPHSTTYGRNQRSRLAVATASNLNIYCHSYNRIVIVITLRAKLSGAVYCNRSCLWVCLFVCGCL